MIKLNNKNKKNKIEILVYYLPHIIEIAFEACEVVASFTLLMFLFFKWFSWSIVVELTTGLAIDISRGRNDDWTFSLKK